MKKGNAKNRTLRKATSSQRRSIKHNTFGSSTTIFKRNFDANYAKAMSFIVKNEEDEIGLMVTASNKLSED